MSDAPLPSFYKIRLVFLFLVIALLYLLIKAVGQTIPFLRNYGTDVLAGIIYYPCVEILLVLLGVRYKLDIGLWRTSVMVITLVAGCGWEWMTPFYRADSVTDPWDLLAYLSGACIALILYKINLIRTPYAQYHH